MPLPARAVAISSKGRKAGLVRMARY